MQSSLSQKDQSNHTSFSTNGVIFAATNSSAQADLLNTHHQLPFAEKASAANESTTQAEKRFSHLLSIMPAGVLVLDKTGRVSLANQQAINLLGEPLIGEAWRNVISRAFAPKADDGHEVSMKNGKRVKIDISALTEEKGQLIVITDLTETRELQNRVGHMKRLSSLGKMVASLAHQVRTPLSSALLYAENLKSMQLKDNIATRFSEKLSMRLRELESQVNDMLLFAKSSDKQIVSLINMAALKQSAFDQVDAQLKQANLSLSITSSIEDLNAQILGNETAIVGALTNLITNAMQALDKQKTTTPDFAGEITLSSESMLINQQQYCVLTVKDNGAGLETGIAQKIFEPFYTTKSQGTGLGLAVVNTVVNSHKGFAKCGNNTNGGAFFSMYIPSASPVKATATQVPTATTVKSTTDQTQSYLARNVEHSGVSHE